MLGKYIIHSLLQFLQLGIYNWEQNSTSLIIAGLNKNYKGKYDMPILISFLHKRIIY